MADCRKHCLPALARPPSTPIPLSGLVVMKTLSERIIIVYLFFDPRAVNAVRPSLQQPARRWLLQVASEQAGAAGTPAPEAMQQQPTDSATPQEGNGPDSWQWWGGGGGGASDRIWGRPGFGTNNPWDSWRRQRGLRRMLQGVFVGTPLMQR